MLLARIKKTYRSAHPVARLGFWSRVLTHYPYALFVHFIVPYQVWSLYGLSLAILLWPFIDLFICAYTRQKSTVKLNMSVDTCLMAMVFLIYPSDIVLFSMLLVFAFDTGFIGGIKLLLIQFTLVMAFILLGFSVYGYTGLESISPMLSLVLLSHAMAFVLFCSLRGHLLLQEFIQMTRELTLLTYKDKLTGSYNRAYFNRNVSSLLSQTLEQPLTFIFADIDHFKKINDEFGHAAGDRVLKCFAQMVNEEIREEEDFLARYGGEEFVIVLKGIDSEQGCQIAERIREKVEKSSITIDEKNIPVTCSFGVTTYQPENIEINFHHLVKVADEGLYRAKLLGRNRVQFKPLL